MRTREPINRSNDGHTRITKDLTGVSQWVGWLCPKSNYTNVAVSTHTNEWTQVQTH